MPQLKPVKGMRKKYRPSSGTEGCWFEEKFCHQCIHERWVHNMDQDREEDKCTIYNNMFLLEVDDINYPKELTYDEKGNPTCIIWKKWDWGNDGDPNDPDNPKSEPPAPDPNQLDLFPLYPTEYHFAQEKREHVLQ